jgi:hypothetical protein
MLQLVSIDLRLKFFDFEKILPVKWKTKKSFSWNPKLSIKFELQTFSGNTSEWLTTVFRILGFGKALFSSSPDSSEEFSLESQEVEQIFAHLRFLVYFSGNYCHSLIYFFTAA